MVKHSNLLDIGDRASVEFITLDRGLIMTAFQVSMGFTVYRYNRLQVSSLGQAGWFWLVGAKNRTVGWYV